ncbi:unnamed protein product [Macrosiphum euphorbiae]|uniref:Uncharacterized protein n=1 Tax=Macrosiphum euphorbiae TaxID=13131 RepID=A0AAV0WWY6_9HEMI|nr:unnamed protein product [Macrosiphum euphorbiae]
MDCAGSSRYLLAVAMIAMAVSLGCAAPIFGLTLSSPRNTSDSAPPSLLSKLQLPLSKMWSIFNTKKDQTSPDNKQQDSQQPTVAEQPGGKYPYQSLANASVTTSPLPKLAMKTNYIHHFSVVPLFSCGEGKKYNRYLKCVDILTNPEDEESISRTASPLY